MIFQDLFAFFFLLVASIIIHEFGHYWTYEKCTGRRLKFSFKQWEIIMGHPEDYEYLTPIKYNLVLASGVISGLLIIFAGAPLLDHSWLYVLLVILYGAGCWHDLKALEKTR